MKYVAHCAACLANFTTHEAMREHVEVCTLHPLAAARAEVKALREALEKIDGLATMTGPKFSLAIARVARAALVRNK